MSTSLVIVDIFPDNPPVLQIERFLTEDLVGVDQPIEYKAVESVLADVSV